MSTEWESGDVVTYARMNALETAVGEMNMSYTPNVWQDGDIVTAAKMNALEQAVASGGGGSSDFSTAEVTVTVTSEKTMYGAIAYSEDEMSTGAPALSADACTVSPEQPTVIKLILYKGTARLLSDAADDATFNITGNIQHYSGPTFIVTGDGTITIS